MKTESIAANKPFGGRDTKRLLRVSGITWFVTAVMGQWIFAIYVASYFAPLIVQKGLDGLKETHLPHGFIAGDLIGNLAIAVHVLLAIIILVGGPLQLMPQIRNRFPSFHRANGRIYLVLVFVTSIAGLYVVWTRGVLGGLWGHIGISLDAVLIMLFAILTLRYALVRRLEQHHRWALRLYMVVNAVWFFRIGLMLWFLITGGAGIDMETFTGPAIVALYFGQMIVPLGFLELYFWAQSRASSYGRASVAGIVFALTGLTAVGTLAATAGMWMPRLF